MNSPVTTRSVQLFDFNSSPRETTASAPSPAGTEVLVRVRGAGVCHSDLHLQDGFYDLGNGEQLSFAQRVTLPVTPGHETAGEVVATGDQADDVAIGTRVLVCSWIGCGSCYRCGTGDEHLCPSPAFLGVNRNGGYSDHIVVPHPKYLVDIGDIDATRAAPIACSGLTTYSAIRKFGPLLERQHLVIIGAGGLGLMAIGLLAKMKLAAPVVVDIDPEKRAAARSAGAVAVLDPADPAIASLIADAVGGPVPAVLDLVGSGQTLDLGVRISDKGGHIVVVGLLGGGTWLQVPLLPMKSLTVEGSYIGSPRELRELVAMLRETGLPDLPVELRPLSDAAQALDDLRAGKVVGRVVLTP